MMQKSLQAHAKVYALILSGLFQSQRISGRLATATRGPRHLSLGVRLNNPQQIDKALKLTESLALAAKTETVLAQRITGLVVYQFQLQESFWQFYTRQDTTGNQIGFGEQRTPVSFELDPPHALFAGTTGSGKTEGIKSALIALLAEYDPTQLKTIIIDQKNILESFDNEAHLLMPRAITGEAASGAILLANNELTQRINKGGNDWPVLVVVIDEVSLLPQDAPTIAALQNLAKVGREKSIHLIIGNQKPAQKNLPEVLDNLLNRFVGQVDSGQTSVLLTGHSGLNAHKLTGRGDFLHIVGNSAVRFQIAMATGKDYSALERREVKPITIQPAPPVDLPALSPIGGRPELQIEYATLGRYFAHKVLRQHLSIAAAEGRFGHKRTLHKRYVEAVWEFTTGFNAELKRLRGAAQ